SRRACCIGDTANSSSASKGGVSRSGAVADGRFPSLARRDLGLDQRRRLSSARGDLRIARDDGGGRIRNGDWLALRRGRSDFAVAVAQEDLKQAGDRGHAIAAALANQGSVERLLHRAPRSL